MKKTVTVDAEATLRRLDYWLDKIEDCYKAEVESSMEAFKEECGLTK